MTVNLFDIANSGEFLSLDIEGDGHTDQSPVEISLLKFSNGQPLEEYHWLINPGRDITPWVSDIHGITNSDVTNSPKFDEMKDDFTRIVQGAVVVAHDMTSDIRLLSNVMPEFPLLPSMLIDTVRFSKNTFKDTKSHNLSSTAEALGISLPTNWPEKSYPRHSNQPDRTGGRHTSSADTWLTGKCLIEMANRIPNNQKQLRHMMMMIEYKMQKGQISKIEDKLNNPDTTNITTPGVNL